MASLNRVMIIGNLGADPEMRYTANQTAVATLAIATTNQWKDKDGQPKEETEWHRVIVWGKLADNCGRYLSKGKTVYVEGRITTRKWSDKEGKDKFTTEIVAQAVQFLSPASKDNFQLPGPPANAQNPISLNHSPLDDMPF